MLTNNENDRQPQALDPQASEPVERMLSALDELMEAARRVNFERRTTVDRIVDDSQPRTDPSVDSQ
jgi:hypothetical protein